MVNLGHLYNSFLDAEPLQKQAYLSQVFWHLIGLVVGRVVRSYCIPWSVHCVHTL